MNNRLAEDYFSMTKAGRDGGLSPFLTPSGTNNIYSSLSWADSPDLDGLTKSKSHTGDTAFRISNTTKIQTDDTVYKYHKIHLTTPVPTNLKPTSPEDLLSKLTGKCLKCSNLSVQKCAHVTSDEQNDYKLRFMKSPGRTRATPAKSILSKKGNQTGNVDTHFSNSVSFDTVNLKYSDDLNNYPLSSFSDSDSEDLNYGNEDREGRSRTADSKGTRLSARSPSRSISPGSRMLPANEKSGMNNLTTLFDLKYPTSPIITHDACTLTRKHKLFDDLYAGRLNSAEPKLHNRVLMCYVSGRKHTWVGIDWACNEFLEDGDSLIIVSAIKNPGRSLSRLHRRNSDVAIETSMNENKIRNSPEYAQAVTENILKYALSILNPNRIVKITVELAVGSTNDVFQDMFELYQPSLTIVGVKPGKAAPTKAWATKRLTDRIVVKSPIPTIIVSPVNMGLYEEKLFKILDKRMKFLNRDDVNTSYENEQLLAELDKVGIYSADDQLEYIMSAGKDDVEILKEVHSISKTNTLASSETPNDSNPYLEVGTSSASSSIFGDNLIDDDNADGISEISVDSENPPALTVSRDKTASFKMKRFELSSQVAIYKETLKLESEPLNEDSFKRYLTVVSDSVRQYGVQLVEQAKIGDEEFALVRTLTGAPEQLQRRKSMVSEATLDEDEFNEKLKKYRLQKKQQQQQLKSNSKVKSSSTKVPQINITDSTELFSNVSPVRSIDSASSGSSARINRQSSQSITKVLQKSDAENDKQKKKRRGFFGLFRK